MTGWVGWLCCPHNIPRKANFFWSLTACGHLTSKGQHIAHKSRPVIVYGNQFPLQSLIQYSTNSLLGLVVRPADFFPLLHCCLDLGPLCPLASTEQKVALAGVSVNMVVTFYQLLDLNPWREEKVDEEALMEMIKADPDKVKLKYRFDAFDEDDLYPLHMVCALGASLDCVKACYKANPDAINHTDTEIGSAVHFACAFGATVDVVHYLAKKKPEALEIPNQANKQTPLHLACQQSTPDSDVVIFLTERRPEAAKLVDSDGRTPLHLACLHDEPNLNIVVDLTEVNGAAGVVKALDGTWPLWSATRHNVDIAILKDLIVSNPQCCQLEKKGFTVLHRAIEMEFFVSSVLKDMIKAHPPILETRDSEDRIPLHYAIECDAPFPIIELFVRRCPETVDMENSRGEIPHKQAERLSRDAATVEFLNPYEEVP